jgi:GDPmannose 4,6-dehydratase
MRIIESVRRLDYDCKVYQQSSSEMFGMVMETPQKETTPFYPRSPYGISKVASHYIARTYREAYGMKIYVGILFNNESERRGMEFLSRKVCVGIADIIKGKQDKIILGNLDAKRDWGYSREYMEWVYKLVQSPIPDEFIIATGETHSVREFVEMAFHYAGIDNWQDYVELDKNLLRAAEVNLLQGDYSKAKKLLGFEPKIKFKELVEIMMKAELNK